ncbi:hypothetical protein LUZ60_003405 [Juncus effusus]|nr:hypothetical protein LUZ60_003405 [Juncus effusus]
MCNRGRAGGWSGEERRRDVAGSRSRFYFNSKFEGLKREDKKTRVLCAKYPPFRIFGFHFRSREPSSRERERGRKNEEKERKEKIRKIGASHLISSHVIISSLSLITVSTLSSSLRPPPLPLFFLFQFTPPKEKERERERKDKASPSRIYLLDLISSFLWTNFAFPSVMASTRKTRKVNRRFAKVNEDFPDKEGPSASAKTKNNKKKKLVDLLGPQWSKEELERFYDSYRKYGKDWRKVGGAVRNRTSDMVEALYNMNRAYLSLPEGAATAAGLIAMMTDHYSNHDGSNSENETPESPKATSKPIASKRNKGKAKAEPASKPPPPPSKSRYPDLLQYEPASSTFAALSALKKKRSQETRPRVVGKRTPRVPVGSMYNRDYNKVGGGSSSKGAKAEEDEGAHVAAMALAHVFHRAGSPNKKNGEAEKESSKQGEGEGSMGSKEAENEETPAKGGGKQRRTQRKKPPVRSKPPAAAAAAAVTIKSDSDNDDDDKEACSGTDEGRANTGSGKRAVKSSNDDLDSKSPWAPSSSARRRNRQLFFGDDNESSALDALHTLADLSVNILQPTPNAESESSAHEKEDEKKQSRRKTPVKKDKRKKPEGDAGGPSKRAKKSDSSATATATATATAVGSDKKEEDNEIAAKPADKGRRRKSTPTKGTKDEADSQKGEIEQKPAEAIGEEVKATSSKGKRGSQSSPAPKRQIRLVISSPCVVSPAAAPSANATTSAPTDLDSKKKHRRKAGIVKAYSKRLFRPPHENTTNIMEKRLSSSSSSFVQQSGALEIKEKMSHCLSSGLFRRWCRCEWFYSAIDYPYFARNEFVEYLNHVHLGHIPRLTRSEWGVIRNSLGKPRRLSDKFLREEREKLAIYRHSVRLHYSDLRDGKKEGVPSDLPRPLIVGQRVTACHPKTRELHDGSVLTVYHDSCRVQFDRPDLGVEFVKDVDCMPLNPLENLPESLRRQNAAKFGSNTTDAYGKFVMRPQQQHPHASAAAARVSPGRPASSHPIATLSKQAQGDDIDSVAQAKAYANEAAAAAQHAMYSQPCTLSQIQEREADIRALAELSRALDKKEALLMEVRNMNEDASVKTKEGAPFSDPFKNQYTMVLVQLRDTNEQVASALLALRQRNTYIGNPPSPQTWTRSIEGSGAPSEMLNNSASNNNNQEAGTPQVVEIMENARRKAKLMVDTAVQAMCTAGEGEQALDKIGEALDSLSTRNSGSGSSILGIRRIPPDSTTFQDNTNTNTNTNAKVEAEAQSPNRIRLPTDLISAGVATLLMIKDCSERPQPPAEVAHILDSCLASMQPRCPQNQHYYREIEMCIGATKNQMLALIPTPLPPDLPLH